MESDAVAGEHEEADYNGAEHDDVEHDDAEHPDAEHPDAEHDDAEREGFEGLDAVRWRQSVRDHEADRYRLAAQASSTLLLAVIAIAAVVAFGGASIVGQVLGRDRLVTPLAIAAAVSLLAGVALVWRYRKDAAALRAHQRAYPGLWDEVESRLKT